MYGAHVAPMDMIKKLLNQGRVICHCSFQELDQRPITCWDVNPRCRMNTIGTVISRVEKKWKYSKETYLSQDRID